MHRVFFIGGQDLRPFARALEESGFQVSLSPPGGAASADLDRPDVIVLDLSLSGEEPLIRGVLERARKEEASAVIALLPESQIASFDPTMGVDDFLLPTAEPSELVARVRLALWKRSRADTRHLLRLGDLVMDLANYTVHVAGRPVDLTYKEYELLRFLATNPDRVFTRETLLNKVWGYDFYGGSRTVDVHIRRLRAKLEDQHHSFIETVRNVGYRFRLAP